MLNTLPTTAQEMMAWTWPQIEPFYAELAARDLTAENVGVWLSDWSRLSNLLNETQTRLYIATTVNTADTAAQERFHTFLEQIGEPAQRAEQTLREKLLASGLQVEGMEVPVQAIRADAELFREANVPLFTQERKLETEYDTIVGAQTVNWEGEERTISGLRPLYLNPDRAIRERAWRLSLERQLTDRAALNDLWARLLKVRLQISANAGFSDYRTYRWKVFKRFDYTPEDCLTFHDAIEQVVVPAAERVYERRRQQLELDALRPWDLSVDPLGRPALHPFDSVTELESRVEAMFRQVDPELGEYFAIMRREGLLDLDNRKNKAPGGYQIDLRAVKRPFIFMNAVGLHDDIQTMLHEGGHAFHCFESSRLPYAQQLEFGSEIAEVASMSMELLAAPYLTAEHGGFYSRADAARARIEHLESLILFWPYMAVVDAFQHWVYTHPDEAMQPAECDAEWARLWSRFMAGVDWEGLEEEMKTGWHRKLHIFQIPFYYVDYGLAQAGAVQVWRNALTDQAAAVRRYREALSLGNTRPLPALFEAAGAKLAFDAATLGELVSLIETTIADLEMVR
jgi:oligoendopeptidase F